MARTPNTVCSVCDKAIYRRPSDMRNHPLGYCQGCKVLAWSKGGRQQADTLYKQYIARWKQGEESGGGAVISRYIRKYLFIKYNSKCCKCEWSEVNPVTDRVPLTVHHVDGDHRNNVEENLELLCPNCHSLTPTYCNLNKGNGRPRK